MEEYIMLENCITLESNQLKLCKATDLIQAINTLPFFEYVSCCKYSNDSEVIIFDIDVEVAQFTENDIRNKERIAIIFFVNDDSMPEVLALRQDFPFGLLHTNIRHFERPISLCIYEEPYDELKLRLTASIFLEDIRRWLSQTSVGKLHQENQALEPFLLNYEANLFIPYDIESLQNFEILFDYEQGSKRLPNLYISKHQYNPFIGRKFSKNFRMLFLKGNTQLHQAIRKTPCNLKELDLFFQPAGIDLFKELSTYLDEHKDYENKLLIIVELSQKRSSEDENTKTEYWGFVILKEDIGAIGEKMGLWQKYEKEYGILYPKGENNWVEIGISLAKIYIDFNEKSGRLLNGLSSTNVNYDKKIFAIGAGSLGSHVINNLTRSGIGKWIIVDNDILLPHNLARHTLDNGIGFYKAELLSIWANERVSNPNYSEFIIENILRPNNPENLKEKLQSTDIILDMSASIAVSRYLSTSEFGKRVISIFFNLAGRDLIILAEDSERIITVDILEMMYYRFVYQNKSLVKHFDKFEKIRYARSCGDLSSTISQDNVAILSGIASKTIKKMLDSTDSFSGIWQMNEKTGEIVSSEIPIGEVYTEAKNGWTICYDSYFRDKVRKHRIDRLPNETGGIIMGCFDINNKKIYLVDSILSPKDSKEYPNSYIRGIDNVEEQLKSYQSRTAGMLKYVGEWHSHPDNCSANPSSDDNKLLKWLNERMSNEGLPAVMLIVNQTELNILIEF